MFEQAANRFPTEPSGTTSDRYAMESFSSVVAGHKAMMNDIASVFNQALATEQRIREADRPRRTQLLASALAEGAADEFNPQDPTQNMMLAYVYNIDRDIDKVARLTSMGLFSEARTEREKIDKIVKDNFNVIHGMTNEEFSRLGPAGKHLQENATRLTTSDLWSGVNVNIHGEKTNVYDALNEDGTSFYDMWAAEVSNSHGAAAGNLIKSQDPTFLKFMKQLPKDASPEFVSRITTTDSNGSSIFGTAKTVFGDDLVYMTPEILSLCKQTGDAANVLDSINIIGASLPKGLDRGTKALSAYKSFRNLIIPSENDAEGGYVDGMKFNAALRAVVTKFKDKEKSIDLTDPAFQNSFKKAQAIVKRCEAWGIPYHASGTSNGWSPNEATANYVYDDLDGLPQDPKNHLASYETLDRSVSDQITGPSPQNPSYATLAQKQENNALTHMVRKTVFQVVGGEISSKSQTPDQALSSMLELQDPNANGGSYNTDKAQDLETKLGEGCRQLGLSHPKARAAFAEALVNDFRAGGGRINIETVGYNLIAELTKPENNNSETREIANAINSFLYTYYTPEGEAMTEQIGEILASNSPMFTPANIKRISRFMSANIQEQILKGANGAQELQRLNNMFLDIDANGKIVIHNAKDATALTPEERLSRTDDNAVLVTAQNNTANALMQAQLLETAKAAGKNAGSDDVGSIKKAITGGSD